MPGSLKESFGPVIYLAVALSTMGAVVLTLPQKGHSFRDFKRRYVLLPLSAAMCIGMSENLRRVGLLEVGNPFLGAATASSAALTFILIMLASQTFLGSAKAESESAAISRNSILFLAAGVCNALGFLSSFGALSLEEVTIITPLMATSPLFTLLISSVFLKRLEIITRNVVIGTLLVVVGVTILFAYAWRKRVGSQRHVIMNEG